MRAAGILGAAMAFIVTTGGAVEIDTNSANFLLPYCKFVDRGSGALSDTAKAFNAGRCAAAVQTIAEILGGLKREREKGARLDSVFCADVPQGVTNGQLVRVVLKFAETHPETTHAPFATFAMVALNVTWPCTEL